MDCRWLAIALSILGIGCGESLTRTRFSAELRCPEDRVRVAYLGANGYRATGCGRTAVYVCPNDNTCMRNGDVEQSADQDTRLEEGLVDGRPGARLRLRTDSGEIVLVVVPSLDRQRAFVLSATDGGSSCDAVELRASVGEPIVLRADATGSGVPLAQLETLRAQPQIVLTACADQRPLEPIEREALSGFLDAARRLGAGAPTRAEAAPSLAVEEQLRSALDARRAAVLACTGSDVAAVRVEWRAGGAVETHLQPPHAGTPEEGCVRAALRSLRATNATTAGTLVHAITRE